ncbi:unnamed protein product [Effrenium voratum]|nr:unnamed protein product [Effrenium voratum]
MADVRRSDESRNAANGRGDLALCDLGMGPLSCFVTMKPLSCDYLAPISADRHEEQVSRQADPKLDRPSPKPKTEPGPMRPMPKAAPESPSSCLSSPNRSERSLFKRGPTFAPAPSRSTEYRNEESWRGATRLARGSSVSLESQQKELLSAWNSGRLLEAWRLVEESRATQRNFHEVLDDVALETLRRVEASYAQSLDELSQKSGDWIKDRDEASDLDMAFRLTNDTLQAVASTVCNGWDVVQVMDGLLQYVLQHEYNGDILVQPLDTELEHDMLLHVYRSGHGANEDNIFHMSWLDALDEPLGALWLSSYTNPLKRSRHPTTFRNAALPKARRGAVRLSFWRSSFAVAPLWRDRAGGGRTSLRAVRVTYALARRPSSAACIFQNMMHREVGKMLTRFKDFLNSENMKAESRAVYDCIRRHIQERASERPAQEAERSFQEWRGMTGVALLAPVFCWF